MPCSQVKVFGLCRTNILRIICLFSVKMEFIYLTTHMIVVFVLGDCMVNVHLIWMNILLKSHMYVHSLRTRKHDYSFYVSKANNVSSTTIYYNGITTWNSLSEEVLTIRNHTRFKKEVKKYFLSSYE